MKLESYITIVSDYFGLGDYPFDSPQRQHTANTVKKTLELNHKIIADFESILQLQFVEKIPQENVCFANYNSELQDDFKQVFTQKDILDYFYMTLFAPDYRETEIEKGYPKNTQEFWSRARLGEELRANNLKC